MLLNLTLTTTLTYWTLNISIPKSIPIYRIIFLNRLNFKSIQLILLNIPSRRIPSNIFIYNSILNDLNLIRIDFFFFDILFCIFMIFIILILFNQLIICYRFVFIYVSFVRIINILLLYCQAWCMFLVKRSFLSFHEAESYKVGENCITDII